ncbi:hypothetical protein H2200_004791 [Cladophialophora chaetospira]|uniref:Uncharacterized protein n=1 Tax=Cladophialophora chaetospira TaxID=386627 RepID=A0AA38XDU5_9EURO|nr:hypothetical protein H2200_004791 [Cladophialophora chaetospira]
MANFDTKFDHFLYYGNILFLIAGVRIIVGLGEYFERWLRRKDEQQAKILNLRPHPRSLSDEELYVLSRNVGKEAHRRGWRPYEYDDESEEVEEGWEQYDSEDSTLIDEI